MSKIDTALIADPTTEITESAATAQPNTNKTATEAKNPAPLILLIIAFALILWGLSIAAFGIPGLYIPALVAVPVIFTMLMFITRG